MTPRTVYIALQQFAEWSERPVRLLEEAGFSVRRNQLGRRPSPADLAEALQDADAVLAGVEPYDAALLTRLPRLACISRCGIGTDAIDLEAAKRLGIAVLTTPDEVMEPVAEMSVAMILALARNLPQHSREAAAGQWVKRIGVLLSEWTIGLVGFGRIGRAVAGLLRPFGPRLLAADPGISPADVPQGIELCPLSALLAASDLVSLHAVRRKDEGPLLGPQELALMKRGSFLVNTSRGYLVDEPALHDRLVSGHLAGAALDVFETEPYTGPLARLPQVLATPHVATLTCASRAAMELRCARNVIEFFARRQAEAPAAGSRHG